MNKIIKSFIFAVLVTSSVSAFAVSKKSIVCENFPSYDWVKNIVGDSKSFDVTLLQNNGTDLHSYQPSIKDIAKISNADMFVFVGGESDKWVEKSLSNAKNKNMVVVNLLETLGDKVKEEEIVEGMEAEEHEHSHNTSFKESDIKARTLSEWNGTWQSTYPHFLNGTLDAVWHHKAEHDSTMSFADYKKKYETAYKTDVLTIKINGDFVEYITKKDSSKAKYKYSGYVFRLTDDNSAQVRFKFEKVSGDKNTPKYIIFSDHNFKPAKPEHFHIYCSDKDFASIEWESVHFPTYYPENMTGKEIAEELMGGHHHHDEEETEYDEHVWLSLKNAIFLVNELSSKIQNLDSTNVSVYKKNTKLYTENLSALDSEYEKVAKSAKTKTVLFGDRFPFRYLTDDYNLKYFAAFVGCSAESEASFKTIAFLSKKVDELGLNAVLTIERGDKKIAKTIISNTKTKNQQILEMDSLQSVTEKDIKNGRNYFSAMKNNLEVLKKALK